MSQNMFSATYECLQCHEQVTISKPTEGQLTSAIHRARFCPECLRQRRIECARINRKVYQARRKAKTPPPFENRFPTDDEIDRGYKKFWLKRGIDIEKDGDPFAPRRAVV